MNSASKGLMVITAGIFAVIHAAAQTESPQPAQAPTSNPATSASPQAPASSSSQPSPAEQVSNESEDRFRGLRANADQLKAAYVKVHNQNMAEVDRLLKTGRCQINRIGGILDRTLDSLHQWHEAEMAYWTRWGEVEQQRVDDERKKLAGMEADQQRVKELLDTEGKDHDELLRRKANLEKYGKRTQQIIQDIDALVQEIKDSEARLADAQKEFDDITTKVKNMNAAITARLISIRQNTRDVESYGLQTTSFYEKKRTEAQDVCNTKRPDMRRSPVPKAPATDSSQSGDPP